MLEKLNIKELGKNQIVITKGDYTAFYSYDTFIIEVKEYNKVTKLSDKYNYSKTTSKYLNMFLKHFCNQASNLKELDGLIKNKVIKIKEY